MKSTTAKPLFSSPVSIAILASEGPYFHSVLRIIQERIGPGDRLYLSDYPSFLSALKNAPAVNVVVFDPDLLELPIDKSLHEIRQLHPSVLLQPVSNNWMNSEVISQLVDDRPLLPAGTLPPHLLADWILELAGRPGNGGASTGMSVQDSVIARLTGEIFNQIRLGQSQNRMATLGFLTAGFGHELNNLLMALSCLSELAVEKPDKLPALPHLIMEQCDRGRSFSSLLLSYAKVKPTDMVEVNVFKEVDGILFLLEHMLRKQRILTTVEIDRRLNIRFPGGLFQQIVLNLFLNAIHAMPNGGKISIRSHMAQDNMVLTVRDNGPGIPKNIVSTIFDPLVSSRPETGAGLGLSICKFLVEGANGSISVANHAEGGAEFTIVMPVDVAASLNDLAFDEKIVDGRGSSVLIVEDDATISSIIHEYLEAKGYRPMRAETGERAIDVIGAERFDLVLLDLNLPGNINGMQVAEQLRRQDPKVPIIVVTGELMDKTISQFVSEMNGLVQKPFRVQQLLSAMENCRIQEAQ